MIFQSIFTRKKAPPCRNVPRFDPARAGGCPPHPAVVPLGRNVQTRVLDARRKCVGSKLRYHTHMAGISYT